MGLMLMMLLWLLAGVIDFGIGFFSYVAIRDAAQEGALYGSVVYDKDHPAYTVDQLKAMIVDRVENSSSAPVDLHSASVQVEVTSPSPWCAGNTLKVDVTYDYPVMMPMVGVIHRSRPSHLRASATSVLLVPSCP